MFRFYIFPRFPQLRAARNSVSQSSALFHKIFSLAMKEAVEASKETTAGSANAMSSVPELEELQEGRKGPERVVARKGSVYAPQRGAPTVSTQATALLRKSIRFQSRNWCEGPAVLDASRGVSVCRRQL